MKKKSNNLLISNSILIKHDKHEGDNLLGINLHQLADSHIRSPKETRTETVSFEVGSVFQSYDMIIL